MENRLKEADAIIREWLYNEQIIDRTELDNAHLYDIKQRANKWLASVGQDKESEKMKLIGKLSIDHYTMMKHKGIFVEMFICDGIYMGDRQGWTFNLRNMRNNDLLFTGAVFDTYLEALMEGLKSADDYDERLIH